MSRKTKVLVVGASGMLGSMILDVLSRNEDLELFGTYNSRHKLERLLALGQAEWFAYGERSPDPDWLEPGDWIVNAAGLISQRMKDSADPMGMVEHALDCNVRLPARLSRLAEDSGAHFLQIGTDCVFSGLRGGYKESSPHDGSSVYAKTKSLGEAPGALLRCSIVGPELSNARKFGLLEWFLSWGRGAEVPGYANCWWNGVTTLEFARVVEGLIKNPGLLWEGVQHLVPANAVSKFELLGLFAQAFGREDLSIYSAEGKGPGHLRLWTENMDRCLALWEVAGRDSLPTIEEMVQSLSQWESRSFPALGVPA